ncbi:MAG TPA: PEP-CTERM sorting domain-containing protein [Vicinamibacterales bacterium]|nr:PEP-CTERM sorting domain-containing protein [Vicinamibacterales bacterium]
MKVLHALMRGSARFGKAVPLVTRSTRATCLALGLVLSSTAAAADPVRNINFGDVFTGGDDTGFNMAGPGFEFSASRVLDPIANCAPCAPGSSFDVSTTLAVTDWLGRATIAGQTYDSVYLRGLFNFTGGSVIVPNMAPGQSGPDNEGLSRASTNFTFTGTLAGFAAPGSGGAPLFSTELSGAGLTAVAFSNFPSESGIRVAQLDYHFQDVSATPEPGSLLLLGSGAAWIAARRRTRLKR